MEKKGDVNPAAEESVRAYDPTPVIRAEHAEGTFTRLIEQQTAKVPSDVFLFGALGSMGLSLGFFLINRQNASRFFGMWAPALLTMGVYNKVVKVMRPQ